MRAKIKSAPTAWTDSATVTATRTRNRTVSARAGTPRLSATSGSTLRKSSGRATTRRTAEVRAPMAELTTTWSGCKPRIEPKSTLMPSVPDAALRDDV